MDRSVSSYLPITRAGMSINFGPMITDEGVQGTSLFYGITGYFMTGRFTPVLELGYAFVPERYEPIDAQGRSSFQRLLPGGLLGYGF